MGIGRLRILLTIFSIVAVGGGALWLMGSRDGWRGFSIMKKVAGDRVIGEELRQASHYPPLNSTQCAQCHQTAFRDWIGTHHAMANRLIDWEQDKSAFIPTRKLKEGDFLTVASATNGKLTITSSGPDRESDYHPEAVIGVAPLRQFLIPFPRGRLQTEEVAYDPAKKEWFDVYGHENRQPHEWGFWKNRGMTWNAQCAFCHTTGLNKGYDMDTDTYKTTWTAMGVSCSQCHGDMTAHLKNPQAKLQGLMMSRAQTMANCASCHARREELTGRFKPGDAFCDHYRPYLVDSPGVYYPDGQVLEEDFEYGSFLMSRMALKGVMCMDCHNSHTSKTILPYENNALCLSCHAPPTRMGAIPIVTATHTFHKAGTAGDRCVDCHMPITNYMQRHPRRDHGFTIPDPLLTKVQGTPNACNRCHSDQTTDWAIDWTKKWYGNKMERRTRQRALLVGRLRDGEEAAVPATIAMEQSEEIGAWRSSLLALLSPWAAESRVREAMTNALHDPDPLVRAAAVKSFGGNPKDAALIRPLLDDPVRLVRLDATGAALQLFDPPGPQYGEYRRYLDNQSDEPQGALRQADLALHDQRLTDADKWARKAVAWEPSGPSYSLLGSVLDAEGKLPEAEGALKSAVASEPKNANLQFNLGLLYGEMNRPIDATDALQAAVRIEPQFGRAWYNLGLAKAQLDKVKDGMDALAHAETLMPESPEPPYALATLQLRQNDADGARVSLQKALQLDPNYQPARELMDRLK
jgi:predicted CXXCH cytochrome family protein